MLIHSSVDGQVGCVHILATVSNATMTQVCFLAFSNEGLCTEVEAGLRNQPGRVIHTQTPESGKSSPPAGLMGKGREL